MFEIKHQDTRAFKQREHEKIRASHPPQLGTLCPRPVLPHFPAKRITAGPPPQQEGSHRPQRRHSLSAWLLWPSGMAPLGPTGQLPSISSPSRLGEMANGPNAWKHTQKIRQNETQGYLSKKKNKTNTRQNHRIRTKWSGNKPSTWERVRSHGHKDAYWTQKKEWTQRDLQWRDRKQRKEPKRSY